MKSRDWSILTWSEKTWSERSQTVLALAVASVVGLAMLVGALLVVGQSLDGVSRYKSEHDWCLKHATNGYDSEQCR